MKTTFFSALLCAATLFLSCSKDNDNKGGGNSGFQWDKGKIFVGGSYKNADNKFLATLWIDGKAKSLSDGTKNAEVFDVAASATKVYAAGSEDGKGVLWTNGVAKVLTAVGSTSCRATSVFVSGEDVYVTTQEITSEGSRTLKLWKNGVEKDVLSQGKAAAEASSVFVSGDDVYVVGMEVNNALTQAVLWTNSTPTFLTKTSGQSGAAKDVIVYESDVYIAGEEGTNAVLWKNNEDGKIVLTGENAVTKSLAVVNGQINVVGYNPTKGMLWVKPLTGDVIPQEKSAFSKINSIATSGEMTYMAGTFKDTKGISTAIFYQDETATNLTDGTHIAYANSIFVR